MPVISEEDWNDLIDYLKHDSWRCCWYEECHCGLDDLTDKLGLIRVPREEKKWKKEGNDAS